MGGGGSSSPSNHVESFDDELVGDVSKSSNNNSNNAKSPFQQKLESLSGGMGGQPTMSSDASVISEFSYATATPSITAYNTNSIWNNVVSQNPYVNDNDETYDDYAIPQAPRVPFRGGIGI